MTDGGRLLPMAGPGRLPKAEPVFDRVAIVHLGAVGASIGLAMRQAWPDALIVGVDRKDVLQQAVHLHAIDVGADDLVLAAEVDLIVLAGADADNARLLGELPEYVSRECLVTSVGPSSTALLAAAAVAPPHLLVIGGDLTVEPAGDGISAARPDLFMGRPWTLSPGPGAASHVPRLAAFVRGVGGVPAGA